jgi:hypothetical protein
MTTAAYNIGAKKTLTGSFTDINGTPVDPSAITLAIREPDGVLVTKAIGDLTSTATGVWTYEYAIAKYGRHILNWAGTAGTFAAFEHEFWARRKGAV